MGVTKLYSPLLVPGIYPTKPIDLSKRIPGTETTGSCITTGTTWVSHTAAGSCCIKVMAENATTSGDFATLRLRARDTGTGGTTTCINASASAVANDYGNLTAIQGYAQPSAVGTTVRTQSNASNIVCALYGCVDRQASATSAGRDWCLWVDTHIGVKATGGTYMVRISHNGTVASDGCFTIYTGGRLPYLFTFEDSAGFLTNSDTRIQCLTPSGAKYITLT